MNEENKETQQPSGSITGFDSVSNGQEPEEGYTVTPEGGYYTKPHEQIIQDEVVPPRPQSENQSTAEENASQKSSQSGEESQPDYKPNGTYGTYNTSRNADFSNRSTPFAASAPIRHKVPKTKRPHQPRNHSVAATVVTLVLAAVLGVAGGFGAFKVAEKNFNTSTPIVSNSNPSKVNINVDQQAESVVEAVAQKATQSVVGIRTTTSVASFFGGNSQETGEGSGVVYSADGYIITNYHVIQEATEGNGSISVFLGSKDSEAYEATVVGYNISADLAVLKIKVSGLTPAEIGDSSSLKVGQYVITIGAPGGLEFMGSTTYGVISGLNREVSSSNVKLIQTDAAINPGNSGGALLNTNGQLIGINSSKIVSTEFEGMGFSIPVNTVVEKVKKIIDKKDNGEGYIGISFSEKYTADVLSYYGYPSGAVVLSVDQNSPAQTAGIQRGDIITEINSKKISSVALANEMISDSNSGETLSVKIYRSGRYYSTDIKVVANS